MTAVDTDWVLSSVYEFGEEAIRDAFTKLLGLPGVHYAGIVPLNRREWMTASASAAMAAAATAEAVEAQAVQNNDKSVDYYLSAQTRDAESRWFGGIPDSYGLHHGGTAMAVFDPLTAAFLHPRSRHHQSRAVFECMERAAKFLDRHTTPEGNVNLLITNFNSPPDTAFGARGLAMGARLAQSKDSRPLLALMRPHVERAGRALAKGGLHTPNHRWIHCSSLAQIHEVFPDPAYVKRIDQWLAEGIDIDEDGQYTERSTGTYNMVVNSSLVLLADKLKRWELLEPVRRNLDAVLHLMHANGELVTDISSRQDRGTRTTIAPYFFPLQYLALRDSNPVFAGLARRHMRDYLQLSYLMTWPELGRTDLAAAEPPANYTRHFARMGVTRLRRGLTSATILSKENSRFFQLRYGDAVVNAVRLATGFFGKGQFRPEKLETADSGYTLTQELRGPYYQPLDRKVGMDFEAARKLRAQTEVCRLTHRAGIVERPEGFDVVLEADGTGEVPVVIEINLREGGTVEGVEEAKEAPQSSYLKKGYATFRLGEHALRFGPGLHEHRWIVVRGAEAKMDGPSIFLTGYTPFRHTLEFRPV